MGNRLHPDWDGYRGERRPSADVAEEKRRMQRYLAPIASGVVCDPDVSLIALSEDLAPDIAVIVIDGP